MLSDRRGALATGVLGVCVLAVASCGLSTIDDSRAEGGSTRPSSTTSTIGRGTVTSTSPEPVPFPTRPRVRPSIPPPPPSTTTTTTSTLPPATTTRVVAPGSACSEYQDTQYLPARSWVTFEREGQSVSLHRVPERKLTIEVTSSDGAYDETWIDPTASISEGLELTTTIGFDWVFDYAQNKFVLEPGQVKTVLRVYDCWTYVDGPDDLF